MKTTKLLIVSIPVGNLVREKVPTYMREMVKELGLEEKELPDHVEVFYIPTRSDGFEFQLIDLS